MTFEQAIQENIISEKPIFVIDDIPYYQFAENGAKLSQERLFAFSDIMTEHANWVLKKEDLDFNLGVFVGLFQRIMNNINNPKEINALATEGIGIATSMKRQTEVGFLYERIFDVAALWFIRHGENPSRVNKEITEEKKQQFLKHPELNDFFLSFTQNIWNPFPTLSDSDFLKFTADDVQLQRLNNMSLLSSILAVELTPEEENYLKLRMETLTSFADYLKAAQKISTSISSID